MRINFREWSVELVEKVRAANNGMSQSAVLRQALKDAYNAGLDRAAEECAECREAIRAAKL